MEPSAASDGSESEPTAEIMEVVEAAEMIEEEDESIVAEAEAEADNALDTATTAAYTMGKVVVSFTDNMIAEAVRAVVPVFDSRKKVNR